MAPKGRQQRAKAVKFAQNENDPTENENDAAEESGGGNGDGDELTLDDVLRLGGTKVRLESVSVTHVCAVQVRELRVS